MHTHPGVGVDLHIGPPRAQPAPPAWTGTHTYGTTSDFKGQIGFKSQSQENTLQLSL